MFRYKDRLSNGLILLFTILVYAFLSYGIVREQFLLFISGISILFLLFTLVYRRLKSESDFSFWLLAAFLIRYVLLFGLPILSDDIYRFYWDGLCSNAGISPFHYTPTELMANIAIQNGLESPAGIGQLLYQELNSPDYFSVYPAFLQNLFAFAVKIVGPDNLLGFSMILKIIILCFEIGSVYLLIKLTDLYNVARKRVLLYALNPLVIIELNANIHFEVIMIFFTLLCVYLWASKKYLAGSTALSLAVATKLLPLIFMPFLVKRVGWLRTIYLGLFILALNVIYHLPFLTTDILQNMYSSVALYYNKFEFNASIYYLMRWLGFKIVGWNAIATIGKLLQLLTIVCIFLFALSNRSGLKDNLAKSFYWALVIFLLLSTTVHPWYIAPLIALGLFYYKAPLYWSFLIFLTYVAYLRIPYSENLWFTFIQYIIVIPILVKEFLSRNSQLS